MVRDSTTNLVYFSGILVKSSWADFCCCLANRCKMRGETVKVVCDSTVVGVRVEMAFVPIVILRTTSIISIIASVGIGIVARNRGPRLFRVSSD